MRAMVKNASVIGVSQFKSIQQNGFPCDLSLGAIKIIDKNNNEGELNYNAAKLDHINIASIKAACENMDLFEDNIKDEIYSFIKVKQ
jgi:hypothetical protein